MLESAPQRARSFLGIQRTVAKISVSAYVVSIVIVNVDVLWLDDDT